MKALLGAALGNRLAGGGIAGADQRALLAGFSGVNSLADVARAMASVAHVRRVPDSLMAILFRSFQRLTDASNAVGLPLLRGAKDQQIGLGALTELNQVKFAEWVGAKALEQPVWQSWLSRNVRQHATGAVVGRKTGQPTFLESLRIALGGAGLTVDDLNRGPDGHYRPRTLPVFERFAGALEDLKFKVLRGPGGAIAAAGNGAQFNIDFPGPPPRLDPVGFNGLEPEAKQLLSIVQAAVPGTSLVSGYRPFSSFFSHHMEGRSIDLVGNLAAIHDYLTARYDRLGISDLIHKHSYLRGGQEVGYAPNDHFDHVHASVYGSRNRPPAAAAGLFSGAPNHAAGAVFAQGLVNSKAPPSADLLDMVLAPRGAPASVLADGAVTLGEYGGFTPLSSDPVIINRDFNYTQEITHHGGNAQATAAANLRASRRAAARHGFRMK